MPQLFANNASSTLKVAISAAETAIQLQPGDGAKFPTPQNGDYFKVTIFQRVGAIEVNWEVLKCIANVNDVLTCVRNVEGPTARAFNAGDIIELRLTAAAILPIDSGALTSALNEAQSVSLASASAMAIGAANANSLIVTGSAQITQFDSIAKGVTRRTTFTGGATLKHNAASMILLSGADITTEAGDWAQWISLGAGNWQMTAYERASGLPLKLNPTQISAALAGQLFLERASFPGIAFNDSDAGANLGRWGAWVNEGGDSFAIGPQTDAGVGSQRFQLTRAGVAKIWSAELTVDNSLTAGSSRLGINVQAAQSGFLNFSTNNKSRWALIKNNAAETGSNAGSDLALARYDDAGSYVNAVMSISRATANVAFSNSVSVGGYLAVTQAIDAQYFVASTANGLRLKSAADASGYGVIHRNDGIDYFMLLTAQNDANGTWNSLRPMTCNLATGKMTFGTDAAYNGSVAYNGPVAISGGAPILKFDETDAGNGVAGLWRLVADAGKWRIDRNTAVAHDLSTYSTMFQIAADSISFGDYAVTNAMLRDCGLYINDKGSSGTANQTFDYTQGSVQTITVTGAHTWNFSNWPPAGNWGAILIKAFNAGSAAIGFGATINWQLPKGGFTTVFADYLTAIGRPALQTSGVDQFLIWNDSTAIYGKLL